MTVDEQTSTAIAAQPVRVALLLYIGIERHTTREAAARLLWPDSDSGQARHRLSQTLYQLRSDFGDGLVVAERELLRARPGFEVDAVEFERAVADGRDPEALSLYRGPFLQGIRLAGTNAFETWVDMRRAKLARLNRGLRRRQIEALIEAGELEAALDAAREWIDLDPSEDEAWQRSIELLERGGRPDDALRRYDEYVRWLVAHDLAPLEKTAALVTRIRNRSSSGSEPANGGDRAPALPGPPTSPRTSRVTPWQVAAAVVALVVIAVWMLGRGGSEPGPAPTRVLVMPFVNQTGDPALDPVGVMAADWIAQGLAWTGQLQVVPSVEPLPFSRPPPPAETGATAQLDAARTIGADLVVSGRFYRAGDSIEFFARIVDVASGSVWHALEPVAASQDEPSAAIDVLRQRLMGALAARLTPNIPLEAPSVVHAPTYDAWTEYRRGTELFISGDFGQAIPHLSRASTIDPEFVRPLLLEASARGNGGDLAGEDSVLRIVADRADRLAPYEQAHLEWARANLTGDLDGAYQAGRRAVALAPGGPANYLFATLTLALGRPRETLEIFSTLDPKPDWVPDWWNSWAWITAAHHALGEHERELDIARAALRETPRAGNALILVRALAALGRVAPLSTTIAEWQDRPGDGVDAGTMLWRAALELRAHGYDEDAGVMLDRAVSWLGEASGASPTPGRRWAYLQALALAGRTAESSALLAGLEAEDPESIDYLGFEGILAARASNRELANDVDARLESLDRPYLRGSNTCRRAAIAAWLREPTRAMALLGQAFREGCSRGFQLHADPDFEPLRGMSWFEELIAGRR